MLSLTTACFSASRVSQSDGRQTGEVGLLIAAVDDRHQRQNDLHELSVL